MKLFEAKHAYYQAEGCYFNTECHMEFETLEDFLEEFGNVDLDYNRVIRWDWHRPDDEDIADGIAEGTPDDLMYCEHLRVYWMMQRKARPLSTYVKVSVADEAAVRDFLLPHLGYTLRLWSPMITLDICKEAFEG